MSEVRLIDANALYREVKTECNPYGKPTIGYEDGKKVLELIDEQPTVEPCKHGRWISNNLILNRQKCSECGFYSDDLQVDNYCPNCGAKMYGGADNG